MLKTFGDAKILLFIALAFWLLPPALSAAPDPQAEADALLQSPHLDRQQTLKALDLYAEALTRAQPPRTPLLTRLARTCFLVGELTGRSQRRQYYEKGRTYAEMLVKEEPARVEGHYWLGMHLCGLADVGGAMQGRKLLPRIMEELERARAIDEAYDQAGSHRVLGRIYYEAPGWPLSVGDIQKSFTHLTAAVRLAPENSTNHLYLAETLKKLNRPDQARQELAGVLKAPRHALLPQGLEDDRQEARRLLQEWAASP